jgi:hypothetical protein
VIDDRHRDYRRRSAPTERFREQLRNTVAATVIGPASLCADEEQVRAERDRLLGSVVAALG